jgi:SAM-dependent methyltransferase/predicted DNA-binding protein YlxM (UPF0122 family)
MNKTKLKNYAPQARKDFIAAVSARANQLGLSNNGSELVVAPATTQGDVTLIEGRDWPAKVFGQRERLIKRMQRDGFEQIIESVAYTWFNRFAALRYMELHDYLDHGYRVLSSTESKSGSAGTPDVLLHAVDLAQTQKLTGLNADEVGRLKLAGNQDGELYRNLLIAQCNALSNAMPFLFERIDDETELLLPDNLLRTDSVIAKLVAEIAEEDWQEVEIIGWLYQYYISEKKDQVIGQVVKSEDIPAATQLFTPNWIVQYMVQNSIGRQWMMANPSSTLKSQWRYYIEPAEQSLEVNLLLVELITTRMDEDGGSLSPETITVLDPACGSGHILVEAYELLKGIYLERGYRLRDIPRLILEKNLFGLDIDDRAAQLAGFALLMKARADDRSLLNEPLALNVLSLTESNGLNLGEITSHLAQFKIERAPLMALLDTFAHAKTFGSLIKIPDILDKELTRVAAGLISAIETGDLYSRAAAQDILPLVKQAVILGNKYDAVVANPPYMGGKGMNTPLKEFAKSNYSDSKADLFAMFIERGFNWCKPIGFNSMVTMQSWMFLSSFELMRENVVRNHTLSTMVHMDNGVMGIAFGTAASVLWNARIESYVGSFSYCQSSDLNDNSIPSNFPVQNSRLKNLKSDDFVKIPGSPIAYWAPKPVIDSFGAMRLLKEFVPAKSGQNTGDNARFLRFWYEVPFSKIGFNFESLADTKSNNPKWFPYNKGGPYKKWYGNFENVINWANDGQEIKDFAVQRNNGKHWSRYIQNLDFMFKEGITWTFISSSYFGARYTPKGHLFDYAGCSAFPDEKNLHSVLALFCSHPSTYILNFLNPTLNLQPGNVGNLPFPKLSDAEVDRCNVLAKEAIEITRVDWDSSETSWNFSGHYMIKYNKQSINSGYESFQSASEARFLQMKSLEEENNRFFIDAYGLQNDLTSDAPDDLITLTRADREKDTQRLISYAIGCMMGRYSLDMPGLIYAYEGNLDFDSSRYQTFPADSDGIVPITDALWFEDDAANRLSEFVRAVWKSDSLDISKTWLAESLGKKATETPDETIRRYLADKFFKDHLQTYKKRPIYWLFSSGKQGAFQALVYLHRYHEGTLARMRAEYVVPLTGKIQSRIEMLERDALSASSTAARNKINKDIEKLKKQHVELLAYDEKLRHYADMRIKLDLDDGVKVNYGKFGDLLDSVKAITGGSDD